MSTVLHICYVHGWNGDHTSFQSFPTDLHSHLQPLLNPKFEISTHIYPTYKAERPIEEATLKLVRWLDTLPAGLVILAGHSLGGFLTADAALMNSKRHDAVQRVIGVLAFDVPYLGIHPHVIISGIASLFQGDDVKTETDMNDMGKVNMVEANESTTSLELSPPGRDPSPSSIRRAWNFISKHTEDPLASSKRWLTERFQFGSCVIDQKGLSDRYTAFENWTGDWVQLYTITVPKGSRPLQNDQATGGTPQEGRRNINEPNDVPSGLAPTSVGNVPVRIEPFGSHPDDITELVNAEGSARDFDQFKALALKEKAKRDKKRYGRDRKEAEKLWRGDAQRQADAQSEPQGRELHKEESLPSGHVYATDPADSSSSTYHTEGGGGSHYELKKHKSSHIRHFIVLPWAMGYRWQSVPIEAVDDEVAAHTGMFFRNQNLDYDGLVRRTGDFVVAWVGKHSR